MKKKFLTIPQTLMYLEDEGIEVTRQTFLQWMHKYKLGKQPSGTGGKWYIDLDKLKELINEED